MVWKRIFDLTFTLAGLIILLPLMLMIAIILKIRETGPVFFRQKRVGQFGKIFTIFKFRTMVLEHDGSVITVRGENRITPFGAFLRKYKLDELPELWNVVKGEMSLVGPRPDVPGYADLLTGENRKILLLKPGITGPATLKYANEESILANKKNAVQYNDEVIYPDKVKLNLDYYYSRSLWLDIKIIFFTLTGINPIINSNN